MSIKYVDTIAQGITKSQREKIEKAHDQNTDTALDHGGANAVTAVEIVELRDVTVPGKVDKVPGATVGNLSKFNVDGELVDAEFAASDIEDHIAVANAMWIDFTLSDGELTVKHLTTTTPSLVDGEFILDYETLD